MKNVFKFAFLGLALTVAFASCNNAETKTEENVDSLNNAIENTVDSANHVIDSIADSTQSVVDSTVKAN